MKIVLKEVFPSAEGFDKLMEKVEWLYEESFPPPERHPFNKLRTLLEKEEVPRRTRMIVALDNDEVVGLSIFQFAPEARLGYLWYLCVAPSARRLGLGSRLYQRTLELLAQDGATSMIFEVDPISTPPHPIYGDPVKRLRFYERLGARIIIGYEFFQKPIPPHDEVRLDLMLHILDGSKCDGPKVARIIEDWLWYLKGRKEEVPLDVRLGSLEELL
ncbi:MAG: GNAT family N-acetyltransferase [Armatimonadetes bacterium]|nr:GNAT family N-acetyltransferase [Armatimonadota bacterium]